VQELSLPLRRLYAGAAGSPERCLKDFGIGFSGRGAVRCGHSSIEGFTLTKN
jgi:hypothetical protein